MPPFACVVRLDGAPLLEADPTVQRTRANFGRVAVGVGTLLGGAAIACETTRQQSAARRAGSNTWYGVSDLRLHNRSEVASFLTCHTARLTDWELVLHALATGWRHVIPTLQGQFAFVAWNPATRDIVLARDALGLGRLYYACEDGVLCVSSRASAVAHDGDRYSPSYLAEFMRRGRGPSHLSAFANVAALPPGTVRIFGRHGSEMCQFWSPVDFPVEHTCDEARAVQRFRELLHDSMLSSIGDGTGVWAELSGGVDSSSIVAFAQSLHAGGVLKTGVEGTLTFVDPSGSRDESPYVEAVQRKWSVPGYRISECWMWQDDDGPPATSDQPYLGYPLFVRNRQILAAVRGKGGSVLLSGHGPDHFLAGNLYYLADELARGQFRQFARDTQSWAVALHRSVWSVALNQAITPILARRRSGDLDTGRIELPWLTELLTNRPQTDGGLVSPGQGRNWWRHRYADVIAHAVGNLAADAYRGDLIDEIEVRHPFLYRPLVEFALRLPPPLRTRPGREKWILREAMAGIVPDLIRFRPDKGRSDAYVQQSLVRERRRLNALLRDGILAELGYIESRTAQAALAAAQRGDDRSVNAILPTLALETWLSVRAGRWPRPAYRN